MSGSAKLKAKRDLYKSLYMELREEHIKLIGLMKERCWVWHSISEPPTKDGKYLITTANGKVAQSHYYTMHSKWASSKNLRPVAWMEFPEAWKGEREG